MRTLRVLLPLFTLIFALWMPEGQGLPVYSVAKKGTVSNLSKKIRQHKGTAKEKAWLQWQLALAAASQDRNELAKNQIFRLLETSKSPVTKDRLYLLMGRILYQEKEFAEAIDWYNKVPKNSDFWLEAKEEIAWSYLRLDQPHRVVETLTTVTSPVFRSIVGPEPYFLSSYASLTVCDYPNVFRVTKAFKSHHSPRIRALEELSKKGSSAALRSAIEKLKQKPFATATVAKELSQLPRHFFRDEFFRRHMEKKSWTEAQLRVQQLAKMELKEYKLMIQKIHLVEAEVIQRIHLHESENKNRNTLQRPLAKSSDTLTFPITKEVWLDEIDNYHAKVKECPKIERAAL